MIFTQFEDSLFFTVTSRYGGVSKTPYDSLNLALHVKDSPKNVLENRTITSEKYNFLIENLIYMEQTHSANIAVIKDASMNRIENCDALITNVKNIPLMVMVADCIPILLYDPKKSVIAVVHAGRNGTFNEIAKKTVLKMVDVFGCETSDILVCLGASIHKCCYEVGEEIARLVDEKYKEKRDEKWYLDLHSMNVDQLRSVGIKNIEISSICTCCDEDYFSYRREGITGRFAGIMKLHG
ncbi:MAG TPA: peptidoglycan editing factor PgeF [Campylobacterales bacterium]|nr:peptidoglycan editing factor PgeF [Campylobacterales bacterium]HIP60095.1 peptidoglycan editing factor PgeF [Campylobacterales bacterium]